MVGFQAVCRHTIPCQKSNRQDTVCMKFAWSPSACLGFHHNPKTNWLGNDLVSKLAQVCVCTRDRDHRLLEPCKQGLLLDVQYAKHCLNCCSYINICNNKRNTYIMQHINQRLCVGIHLQKKKQDSKHCTALVLAPHFPAPFRTSFITDCSARGSS